MCRASYLVSNIGDAVKCYGRALGFPQDRHLYLAEMKLALGNVIMQCRLIEEENNYEHNEIHTQIWDSINGCMTSMMYYIANTMDHLERGPNYVINFDEVDRRTAKETTQRLLDTIGALCSYMIWNVEEIEHTGFIHTIERFEQFEQDDWK